MMSAKVKKFNKYQIGQGRNFVITNTQLYNFNVKSKSFNFITAILLRVKFSDKCL